MNHLQPLQMQATGHDPMHEAYNDDKQISLIDQQISEMQHAILALQLVASTEADMRAVVTFQHTQLQEVALEASSAAKERIDGLEQLLTNMTSEKAIMQSRIVALEMQQTYQAKVSTDVNGVAKQTIEEQNDIIKALRVENRRLVENEKHYEAIASKYEAYLRYMQPIISDTFHLNTPIIQLNLMSI